MCKRSETDPLLRLFFDRYHLHLLRIPRENLAVGDVFMHRTGRTSPVGRLSEMMEPGFTLPAVEKGEILADVAATVSRDVEAKLGLRLLEGFLAALGSGGAAGRVRAGFEASGARSLRFCFREPSRDSVSPIKLGVALARHTLATDNPLHQKGNEYYVVTAVVRSPSISVIAGDQGSGKLDIDVDALSAADLQGRASVEHSVGDEVIFTGRQRLVFGLELFRLTISDGPRKLQLSMPRGAISVRDSSRAMNPVEPAVIGGPDGDAFLTLA